MWKKSPGNARGCANFDFFSNSNGSGPKTNLEALGFNAVEAFQVNTNIKSSRQENRYHEQQNRWTHRFIQFAASRPRPRVHQTPRVGRRREFRGPDGIRLADTPDARGVPQAGCFGTWERPGAGASGQVGGAGNPQMATARDFGQASQAAAFDAGHSMVNMQHQMNEMLVVQANAQLMNQQFTTASNVARTTHDTVKAAINNIRA